MIPALVLEHPQISSILTAWLPILYAGIMSCGVAYTLQIVGQKNVNPTVASLILSLESCISVLAGWVILGQKLSAKELLGCVIMFAAIILAQLPEKSSAK
jgi:drug/metabolite transporter (DMT)-like permease